MARVNQQRNETILALRDVHPEWTMLEIAAAAGANKNIVIGVLNRSGMLKSRPQKAPRVNHDSGNGDVVFIPKVKLTLPKVCEPVQHEDLGDRKPVGFLELEFCHCRWPVGRGSDGLATFCGAKKLLKSSYCSEHFQTNPGSYQLR